MDVITLSHRISTHLTDPAQRLVNTAQLLDIIKDAAEDASNGGWLIELEDNESLTFTTGTYEYAVPASFYFLSDLYYESTVAGVYTGIVLPHEWRLATNGAVPVIRFDKDYESIPTGRKLRVIGWRRPTTDYDADGDTIDAGMEAFLRERSLSYSARYLARDGSQFARQNEQLFQDAFGVSDKMLQERLIIQAKRMAEFQVQRQVPGR